MYTKEVYHCYMYDWEHILIPKVNIDILTIFRQIWKFKNRQRNAGVWVFRLGSFYCTVITS